MTEDRGEEQTDEARAANRAGPGAGDGEGVPDEPGDQQIPDLEWDPATLGAPIEALLLMATEPIPAEELARAVGAPTDVVIACLEQLTAFYDETGRGFGLRRVGQGWRYYTRAEHAELIGAWLLDGQPGRLSQAALETLAVVAYLQPISRGRVAAVRGVNVDGVIRTLATRDLIEEVGRDPESGARLFATTANFLERMGLTSLDELPPLAPHLPDASALEAELAGLANPTLEEATE